MADLVSNGWAKLDAIVSQNGKDWLRETLVTRVAEGESPNEIARSFGLPYVVIRKWIEENAADLVGLARRAHADILVSEALKHIDEAQIEDVAVARLKAETKLKIAGKMDRGTWGEGGSVGGGFGGVTIVIGDVVPDGVVIEGEGRAVG